MTQNNQNSNLPSQAGFNESSPAVAVTLNVPSRSPVVLLQVQAVLDRPNASRQTHVARLQGTIVNNTDKPVTKLAVSVTRPKADYLYYAETGDLHITSRQSIAADLGFIEDKESIPSPLSLQVTGVQFADGSKWGRFQPGLIAVPFGLDQDSAGGLPEGISVARHGMPPTAGIEGKRSLRSSRKRAKRA